MRSRPASIERASSDASALLFGCALQLGRVAVPLLVIDAGHGFGFVGLLAGVAASMQLAARSALPWFLRRRPDRVLMQVAVVLLGLSYLLIGRWQTAAVFLAAESAQGCARAFFWTGSEVHAVNRDAGDATRSLARLQMVTGVGGLVGPAIGGRIVDVSFAAAVIVAGGIALAALLPSLLLARHEPSSRTRPEARSPRLGPRVLAASWGAFCLGGWRALLSSYMPVLLSVAGHSGSVVGALLAGANGAVLVAAVALTRIRLVVRPRLLLWSAGVCAGLFVATVAAGNVVAAAVALTCSGLSAGVLQVVAPAAAASAADPTERAAALVTVGMFRSGAFLVMPLLVAGLAPGTGLVGAMAFAQTVLVAPTVGQIIVGRRPRGAERTSPTLTGGGMSELGSENQ